MLGCPGTPTTAVTRPPATDGPTLRKVRLLRESMPGAGAGGGCAPAAGGGVFVFLAFCAMAQGAISASPSTRDVVRMLLSSSRMVQRARAAHPLQQHAGDRRGQEIGQSTRDHGAEPEPCEV